MKILFKQIQNHLLMEKYSKKYFKLPRNKKITWYKFNIRSKK